MTTMAPRMTPVTSPDGTRIAVFVSGHGRPLVVVPGTTSDHTTWRLLAPKLENSATVHAVDRRGRGASGDHPDYALDKEYADVAAVVDAAAASWGGPVDLLGHSYGGNVAFGAALRTQNLRSLALYEGWPVPNLADRTVAPALSQPSTRSWSRASRSRCSRPSTATSCICQGTRSASSRHQQRGLLA